ncbi:MAG: SUKH-3 domain-containing protein [Prevotella sp.]|nr:SUKH-3 domain-containing protein [Alistipes senegalensis]MCM1358711.1 SUKH-3 domain-containing protein [Prevotella sp.]
MTREEFNDFKKNHALYVWDIDLDKLLKEAEEKSIRDNFNEQFKKADMNNIIEFFRDFGSFSFRRTEKKSGDVITFDCSPFQWCDYWKDLKQIAFHIGHFENSSGDIERLYMLEDGSFYNYERKKIADNTPDFLDYITTVEYDYHAPISENTYKQLKKVGWYEGRKIDISGLVRECEKDGVFLTEPQKRFIEEFGGLDNFFKDKNDNYWFDISDKRTSKHNEDKPVFFINIFHDKLRNLSDEKIIDIAEKYGENTVCIGAYGYWCDEILLTEKGLMIINFEGDIEEYGRTAMEGFNKMLG